MLRLEINYPQMGEILSLFSSVHQLPGLGVRPQEFKKGFLNWQRPLESQDIFKKLYTMLECVFVAKHFSTMIIDCKANKINLG